MTSLEGLMNEFFAAETTNERKRAIGIIFVYNHVLCLHYGKYMWNIFIKQSAGILLFHLMGQFTKCFRRKQVFYSHYLPRFDNLKNNV